MKNLPADSVQGVLFLAPGPQSQDAIKLWDSMFPGDMPDGFQRAQGNPPVGSTASGERDDFSIVVSAQPGRVDLFLKKPDPAQAPVSPPPSGPSRIENVTSAIEKSTDLLHKLSKIMSISRVALVLDLAKSVEFGTENLELKALLPSCQFPANATDIGFQFNTRIMAPSVSNVELNRFCAWSSGKFAFFPTMPNQASAPIMFFPYVGIRIDVNSIGPQTSFSQPQAKNLINDIAAESVAVYNSNAGRLFE